MPRTPEAQYRYNQERIEARRKNPRLNAAYLKYMKGYYEARKDTMRAKSKAKRDALRLALLSYYANGKPICACCGERETAFLTIDHINGGGNKHRRQNKIVSLYKWIHSQWLTTGKYPTGFQVMCMNCNVGKFRCGVCPHKK
jgi:hypothetical protein